MLFFSLVRLFEGVYFVWFLFIECIVVLIICCGVLKLGLFVFKLMILWFVVFNFFVFVVIVSVVDGVNVDIFFVSFNLNFF